MAVDPSELERLMKEAGVDKRAAQKLRQANEGKPPSPGHGASAPIVRSAGKL